MCIRNSPGKSDLFAGAQLCESFNNFNISRLEKCYAILAEQSQTYKSCTNIIFQHFQQALLQLIEIPPSPLYFPQSFTCCRSIDTCARPGTCGKRAPFVDGDAVLAIRLFFSSCLFRYFLLNCPNRQKKSGKSICGGKSPFGGDFPRAELVVVKCDFIAHTCQLNRRV